MGLIKAVKNTISGVISDQWKEYFYCSAIPETLLAVKGQKKTGSKSQNKGQDNIISNGSVIAVATGQCMLIVEQGKVVDLCAEPGEYTYDMSTEPSIFAGNLGESIKGVLSTTLKRFTYGGDTAKDQRVYYINTKEIVGNKYGTASPVPFRVVDQRANIDIDISIRCFGEYSYRISNPMLFYVNVMGNVDDNYPRTKLDSMLKSELLTALQPTFAKLSEQGIRYSALPGHTEEISQTLNEILSAKWRDLRGIEIVSCPVSSVKASEEDEAMLKELQKTATYTNVAMRDAGMASAQMDASRIAAGNTAGAAVGFMGMNMANGAMNGYQYQTNYAQPAQQAAPAAAGWTCPNCGATATGKFCPECGTKKPEVKPAGSWTCPSCGATATGKFCPECGTKKPEDKPAGWTCPSCGAIATGKFCPECGTKKPAGVPQYKCDKCGWVPEDPTNPPKFCPQCGDPFDNGDITG